jgi:hypothetical protein
VDCVSQTRPGRGQDWSGRTVETPARGTCVSGHASSSSAALVQVVARPRLRGTCPSGRTTSSPWRLSKWSHDLVPVALVYVVAHPRPQRHLSKWSRILVLAPDALVQVVARPRPCFRHLLVRRPITGAHSYGDASSALTRLSSAELRTSTSSLRPSTVTSILLIDSTHSFYLVRVNSI